jgi:hypothetical protein
MSLRIWICGLALVLVAVAGVALAEGGIPGPNGVINACRKIEGGRLRAVRAWRAAEATSGRSGGTCVARWGQWGLPVSPASLGLG